jgi:hypothetical protein
LVVTTGWYEDVLNYFEDPWVERQFFVFSIKDHPPIVEGMSLGDNLGFLGSIDKTTRLMSKEKVWDLVHNIGFDNAYFQGNSLGHNQSFGFVGRVTLWSQGQ